MIWLLYPYIKGPWYLLDIKVDAPQGQPGHDDANNPCHCLIKPQPIGRVLYFGM
jgi:hypothetical protein